MSNPLRNALSVALLVVALFGAFVDYREYQAGVPGNHRLMLAAYFLIAIYAAATLVLRMRAGKRK